MLPVAEAQARILAPLTPTPVEWVGLPEAQGRVLAADLHARRDQPPVAVSAMDGYAVRAADTTEIGRPLRLIGEAAAGGDHGGGVGAGEAVRTFTGGAVPPGADAIVIQENAEAADGLVRFTTAVEAGTFVRAAGLDFPAGWAGLVAGTWLDGRALGLAAAMGHVWIPVRRRPRIGLLATGNELRLPGETPVGSQIISSNTMTVGTMASGWGATAVDLGICPDDGAALARRVRDARGLEMLVTTGGASVGDYDLVQSALEQEGLILDFWKIAMRPGKPLLFGQLGELAVLGFPGNPVSSGVCAIVFLRMALQKLLGLPVRLPHRQLPLAHDWARNDRRQDYLRGTYQSVDGQQRVHTAARQDSSMLATFAAADALVVRPAFDPARTAGEMVAVIDLREALDSLR